MCFITNGDLNDNLRIIYNKIKNIENRQITIINTLNNILLKLNNYQDKIDNQIKELKGVNYENNK